MKEQFSNRSGKGPQEKRVNGMQLALLTRELRTKKNVEEVAARLTDKQKMTHDEGIQVLNALAERLQDEPGLVQQLIEQCRTVWPSLYLGMTRATYGGKQEEDSTEAEPVAMHALPTWKLHSIGAQAIEADNKEDVQRVFDVLLGRIRKDPRARAGAIGLLYLMSDKGQTQQAEKIWRQMINRLPRDQKLITKFHMFQRKSATQRDAQSHDALLQTENGKENASQGNEYLQEARTKLEAGEMPDLQVLCDASLRIQPGQGVISGWLNCAADLALQQNAEAALTIWRTLLEHRPDHRQSFLKFCMKHGISGLDAETDSLIKKDIDNKMIRIGAVIQSANSWLTEAKTLSQNDKFEYAFLIWNQLLKRSVHFQKNIVENVTEIAARKSPQELVDIVPTSVQGRGLLLASVGKQLFRKGHTERAEALLKLLIARTPENPESYSVLATHYVRNKKYKEAFDLWIPLAETHALSCAETASQLTKAGQKEQAHRLFMEVARVSPQASIQYGYEHLLSTRVGDDFFECLQPLLPQGNETAIQDVQLQALRLLMRHGRNEEIERILKGLVVTGAIQQETITQLHNIPVMDPALSPEEQRDREIEEFVRKRARLSRSPATKIMTRSHPIIRRDQAVNGTVSTVIMNPHRPG